jgi:hypothetical protein
LFSHCRGEVFTCLGCSKVVSGVTLSEPWLMSKRL